jgi:dehydrogenase/reductase SDR family protein 1
MPNALVTGASRGVGKGIAISLARSCFQVFATGRTIAQSDLPNEIVRIACDHTIPGDTEPAFKTLTDDGDGLEILVNNAWGGYERMIEDGQFTWTQPFWQQPEHRWQSMMEAGVHTAFTCSAMAARMMIPARRGLIVNISFWAAQKHVGNTIYGIAKAATDKMTSDMAHELRGHNVTVVSLYPGLVRTESVLSAAEAGWLDLSNSESPEYLGKVIAALARDPHLISRTGKVVIAAELGAEYGLTDVGGVIPAPLSLAAIP